MGWRDQLQKGKFRDAEFKISGSEGEIGRRVVPHEYPLRDLPYVEDLGRKARGFQVEIYVIGSEYMAARDKLIEALEKPGPGTLVHPYLGTMTVSVLRVSGPRESTSEGGLARFSVTFIESGENKFPAAGIDTAANTRSRADEALTAISGNFEKAFSVSGLPEFVATKAVAVATAAFLALESLSNSVQGLPAESASFSATLKAAVGNVATLVRNPTSLASELTGIVAGLSSITSDPAASLKLLKSLWTFGDTLPVVSKTTPSRIAQANNQAALTALTRQAAAIEAARSASEMTFDSFDQAVEIRDQVADRLDLEMETAADDVYSALADLRVATIKDITARGADLSRIVNLTPPVTLPSLVLAYQFYGDSAKAADIVGRNGIRHPGFVTGGRALEVLTRG